MSKKYVFTDICEEETKEPERLPVNWNDAELVKLTKQSIEVIRAVRGLPELTELSLFLHFLNPRILDELGVMLNHQRYLKSLKLNL